MEKVSVGLSLYPKYARNSPKVILHISKPKGSLGYHYTRNHLCSGKTYQIRPHHGQPCHYYNLVQLLALSQMRFFS